MSNQRHFFIAAGGTGTRALAGLKKVFKLRPEDTKELVDQDVKWDFLSIDSSKDVWENKHGYWKVFGESTELESSQKLELEPAGLASELDELVSRPDIEPWIGDVSVLESYLGNQEGLPGAGQRRRFGRVLFAGNAESIRDAIESKTRTLTENAPAGCTFHLFATIGGGTGSGCLIDLVTTIRDLYSSSAKFPIFIYLFCSSEKPQDTIDTFFFQNQYAALRDLNALMVGRMRPLILRDHPHPPTFKGKTPVSGVSLITNNNGEDVNISLETQISVAAEGCFERMYTFGTGQLDEGAQKAVSLEDVGGIDGEPTFGKERSYRFGSLGMRRWELPNDRIKELLSLDLSVSALRQMLFNNWEAGEGYVEESSSLDQSSASALEQIHSSVDESSATKSLIGDKLGQEAKAVVKALGRKALEEKGSVQALQERFSTFSTNEFRQVGLSKIFQEFTHERKATVAGQVENIELQLTRIWLKSGVGLKHIIESIDRFREILEAKVRDEEPAQGSVRRDRKPEIENEFLKLTNLSYGIKAPYLFKAYEEALGFDLDEQIKDYCTAEDRQRREDLKDALQVLRTRFEVLRSLLTKLLGEKTERRNLLAKDLVNMGSQHGSNKYELDSASLESFRDRLKNDQDSITGVCSEVRGLICREEIGKGLGSLNRQQVAVKTIELEDKIFSHTRDKIEGIHTQMVSRGEDQILYSSIMQRLEERFAGGSKEELKKEAKQFISRAVSGALIRKGNKEMQPAQIIGRIQGGETMPRRILVVGIPRHTFSDEIKEAIKQSIPAGIKYGQKFYEHNDPLQIRVLVMDYWMAARFAEITHDLAEKFDIPDHEEGARELRYFCNIDPDGEEGRRPGLLVKDIASEMLRASAALWIGKQLSPPLFEEDEDQIVHLIRQGKHGPEPINLESDYKYLETKGNRTKVATIVGGLIERLDTTDKAEFKRLRAAAEAREVVMVEQYSPTHEEYQRWIKVRSNIFEFLEQ